MNRWKTIAMMSMGFTCGVVWTAACGGADSAKADDSSSSTDGDNASIAEALAQIAELVTTVSAQQAAIVALESDVAALESDVVELEQFKSSSLCFIGHMTDDKKWVVTGDEYWGSIFEDYYAGWNQGPNSDAQMAYDDCF
tara:strand:+ start:297 stop:716 length:420 start_codon:yes stop_codon:yes gene_type:complete